MSKLTPNEAKERKEQIIKLGRDMATMIESSSWKYLEEKLSSLEESAKQDALGSPDWETLLQKRGYLEGLGALKREVASTISRAINQERTLKSK